MMKKEKRRKKKKKKKKKRKKRKKEKKGKKGRGELGDEGEEAGEDGEGVGVGFAAAGFGGEEEVLAGDDGRMESALLDGGGRGEAQVEEEGLHEAGREGERVPRGG